MSERIEFIQSVWARRGAKLFALLLLLAAPAAGQSVGLALEAADPLPPWEQPRPNLLLIVADDLGVDRVAVYAEHPDPGHTPVIDALAEDGVLFRNAWANPGCSPTRATILTGRYSFRTGIGRAITYSNGTFELSPEQPSLPRALRGAAGPDPFDGGPIPLVRAPRYHVAAVGKWHLGTALGSGPVHPLLMGFEHHAGPLDNLPDVPGSYYAFEKHVDGVRTQATTYATTDQVDDVLAQIDALPEPWFLWLAFSASHGPFHAPPPELHGFELPPQLGTEYALHHQAMTEAMDTEIGRLLQGLPRDELERTVVVFVGDNGTPADATTAPFDPQHAKGTPFEGGVNVPLIVKGPGVAAGAECAALVNTTDLYATFCELGGRPAGTAHDPVGPDSVSLVPYFGQPELPSLRSWVYAESFGPNGFGPYVVQMRTVREERYKLIWRQPASGPAYAQLFDLAADPFELVDLLREGPLTPEQQVAHDWLWDVLDSLR